MHSTIRDIPIGFVPSLLIMNASLVNVTLVVKDYDEALDFYVNKLGFEKIEDTQLTETKRWVRIRPNAEAGCCLLLAQAKNEQELQAVGNQTGGRVFLFIHTQNIEEDLAKIKEYHIEIVRGPVEEPYGKVAVFKDLYGNLIDLIQPN